MYDGIELCQTENVPKNLIGLAVDYLTRYCTGTPVEEAFKISIRGAFNIREYEYAERLLQGISGLDDTSITNALRLSGYDVCYRAGSAFYKPVEDIVPDVDTIANVRTMVNRSLSFIAEYGPIVKDGFTFDGGYTDFVSTGDGDFLTATTLWDYKVSIAEPTNKHTLQLLMYYIMGMHSVHKEFQSIKILGIFNPRLNKVYLLEIGKIDPSIIEEVSTEVIGY